MQTVSFAGSSYNIPNTRGDRPWGGLSDFVIAAASKAINTAGGNFTLLADINFGATFGLVSTYYKSRSSNIADAGQIRLANTDTIKFRNTLNNANLSVAISSNRLTFEGSRLVIAGAAEIVNADISASAAIVFSKMAALSNSIVPVTNGSGVITSSSVTATELGYVSGVTSAIQTQLAAKATLALDNLASVAINTALLPGTDNSIGLGSSAKRWTDIFGKDIDCGASGTAGTLDVYPTTASKGKIQITAADSAGNTTTTLTNASQAGARTYTIPDAGASASFVMTEGTQTVNGSKTLSGTINLSGLTLSTALALDASKNVVSVTNTGSGSNVLGTAPTISNLVLSGINSNLAFVNTSTQGIGGATNGGNAAAGNVGEYIESVVGNTSVPSTGTWGDMTSMSLTAGDWDVSFNCYSNNQTSYTNLKTGISTTSGNSATGLVAGSNFLTIGIVSNTESHITIANYRMSLSGTTTVYAKMNATFTGTTPQISGRLSARRMR